MSRGYILTPLAETDPDDIRNYAAQRFGFDVADEVLEPLHRAFRFLAEHPDAAHLRQPAQHLLLRSGRHELPGFEGRVIVSGCLVASPQAQQESVDEAP